MPTKTSNPAETLEARRAQRLNIFVAATVRWSGRAEFAFLLDLSTSGAKLGGQVIPQPGEAIWIECQGEALSGRCAWARVSRYGIAFDAPISRTQSKAILAS